METAMLSPPTRTNRYAAPCAACGVNIPAEQGNLTRVDGAWKVRHCGDCPALPAARTITATVVGVYKHDGRIYVVKPNRQEPSEAERKNRDEIQDSGRT